MKNNKTALHSRVTTGKTATPVNQEGWLPGFIVGQNVARAINALPSGKEKTALQRAMDVFYSYGQTLIGGFSAPIEA